MPHTRSKTPSSYISGWGMSVPEKIITNQHFSSYLETTNDWIIERTGIKERRFAEVGVGTSEFAASSADLAIVRAGLSKDQIDGVIVATITPDYSFPSVACLVQEKLQLKKGFAFDLGAACGGFVYALTVADSMIAKGIAKNILVIGVDLMSKVTDQNDRSTAILFGDGGGAVVLSATTPETGDRGILSSAIYADGDHSDILGAYCGTKNPYTQENIAKGEHYLKMNGREVFKIAVRTLTESSLESLNKASLTINDLDWVIAHQANQRILTAVAEKLAIDQDKMLSNVERYGNTSAGSIPILLSESIDQGVVKQDDIVILTGVGGGMTWGAVTVRI